MFYVLEHFHVNHIWHFLLVSFADLRWANFILGACYDYSLRLNAADIHSQCLSQRGASFGIALGCLSQQRFAQF